MSDSLFYAVLLLLVAAVIALVSVIGILVAIF